MKLTLIVFFLFATAVLHIFCKNTKYTADQLPKEQIRFGKGGGIVGVEKTYTLLENGQVFEKVINGGLRGLDGVKKKKATALFRTAETLGLAKAGFQYPGNTYSYIEVPLADGFNRISWGDNQHPIDSSIQNYFKALMEMVKTE